MRPPACPFDPPPHGGLECHRARLLRLLLTVCESLRRLQAEPAAKQACVEVAALLRAQLQGPRRTSRRTKRS